MANFNLRTLADELDRSTLNDTYEGRQNTIRLATQLFRQTLIQTESDSLAPDQSDTFHAIATLTNLLAVIHDDLVDLSS